MKLSSFPSVCLGSCPVLNLLIQTDGCICGTSSYYLFDHHFIHIKQNHSCFLFANDFFRVKNWLFGWSVVKHLTSWQRSLWNKPVRFEFYDPPHANWSFASYFWYFVDNTKKQKDRRIFPAVSRDLNDVVLAACSGALCHWEPLPATFF